MFRWSLFILNQRETARVPRNSRDFGLPIGRHKSRLPPSPPFFRVHALLRWLVSSTYSFIRLPTYADESVSRGARPSDATAQRLLDGTLTTELGKKPTSSVYKSSCPDGVQKPLVAANWPTTTGQAVQHTLPILCPGPLSSRHQLPFLSCRRKPENYGRQCRSQHR